MSDLLAAIVLNHALCLKRSSLLLLVASGQKEPCERDENVEQDVEAEVGGETLLVARLVRLLEDLVSFISKFYVEAMIVISYLRCCHVTSGPCDKCDSQ